MAKTKNFLISDISMNDCIRPSLYGSYHHVGLAKRGTHPRDWKLYDVVGPICESGDFVGKGIKLPSNENEEIFKDNLVVLFDVGAYSGSMSSNYNLKMRPCDILIDEENQLKSIAKKENLATVHSRRWGPRTSDTYRRSLDHFIAAPRFARSRGAITNEF